MKETHEVLCVTYGDYNCIIARIFIDYSIANNVDFKAIIDRYILADSLVVVDSWLYVRGTARRRHGDRGRA
jgi:hypothetical protein